VKKWLAIALLAAGVALVWWVSASSAPRESAPLEPLQPVDGPIAPAAALESTRAVESVPNDAVREVANAVVRSQGIHLFGSIRRADGDELVARGVSVRLLDERADDRPTRVRDDLVYSYTGLRPGRVWLSVEASGCCRRNIAIDLAESEPERRVDVELAAQTRIDVRMVTATGEPIASASSIAIDESNVPVTALDFYATLAPIDDLVRATRDLGPFILGTTFVPRGSPSRFQQGYSQFDEDPRRHAFPRKTSSERNDVREGCVAYVETDRPLPLWVSVLDGSTVLSSQLVPTGATEVTFAIRPGSDMARSCRVRVTIINETTRAPVAGATVWLGNPPPGRMRVEGPTLTDANGNFEFGSVRVGWNELNVAMTGFEPLMQRVELTDCPTHNIGLISLREAVSIAGRMVDESNHAIVASVEAVPFGPFDEARRSPEAISANSSGPGFFQFTTVGRGRNVVSVRCVNWISRPVIVDTTAGPVKDLVLRCVGPSKVAIFVPATAPSDTVLRLETDDGLPVFEDFTLARERIDVAVAKGKCVLRLGRGKERILERAFEVRGEGLTLDLTR
jgi:hypothetical protein